MFRVAVIGARGYTGAELLPLLHRHPEFELIAVGSGSAAGQPVNTHVEGLEGSDLVFEDIRPRKLQALNADACVLALPNGHASRFVDALDAGSPETVVVDLSADYRFDPAWSYGQPDRFGTQLMGAKRIANPGCYATGAQLALAPLVEELSGCPVVFGVSGYSGAGKTPSRKNDPEVLADNILPYSLVGHIHEREVSHHLGRDIRFLPHVAPFFRGISLTISAELLETQTETELLARYQAFYSGRPLIGVQAAIPEVRQVRGTHHLIVGGFVVSEHSPCRVSMVAVLDNLLKGAATQAVQNLNLAFGLDAMTGLDVRHGRQI
ncbi:MAG: N-acetyl-gamma-glutamyl-phosphate reductase [Xanthomonadales bacterium]|nr:N-acetyl-gamma-glutamyl-phosphate reductase [Gammaproteobacteria bacterium]MBT8052258.1 N-acetyl-gamma-glutamyl-phosphate reductase [Gammaproteobacteria bacterium]NND57386.1 N-acetyl-gamma-glutamyl-phosphate reductase [Xanthomonadales bacterium]NNK52582.1 N-acetyl-gamma-glutamyl-phosphate reductase [Xanthomonadales bacterium]